MPSSATFRIAAQTIRSLTNPIREIGTPAAGRKRFTALFGAVIARFDQHLVAGGEIGTRCGRERISMPQESAIRAPFVRDSFAGVKGATQRPWFPSHCDTDSGLA